MRVLGREGRRVRVRERWWRTGPRAKDEAAHRPGKGEEVDSPQGNPSFYMQLFQNKRFLKDSISFF